jgi:hypothetical protein
MHPQSSGPEDPLRASVAMLTLDGVPLRCIKCGSTDLAAVGREFDLPALEMALCHCGQGWKLDTLVTSQHVAPKPGPKARTTDPEPSQQAARLDFGGQTALVLAALIAMGEADATQITERLQTEGHQVQRSVIARRLTDLEQSGAAAKVGEHINNGRPVTIWRATRITRNDAA